MANHKDDIGLPDCSLRYHKSEVTSLIFVTWPLRSQTPILISGDAGGVLVCWDPVTRRPIFTFNRNLESRVVVIQDLEDGLIAVLFKDHKLRFLQLPNKSLQSTNSKGCDTNELAAPELNEIYKIPVNTLNFANFLLQKIGERSYRLVCTNTQDSEAIDIYTFNLSDMHSLKRIYKGVNFSGIIEKIPNEPPASKADKLGIVMKFIERDGDIYCGLESGYVIGFRLHNNAESNEDNISSSFNFIEIVYVSSAHYPNPVLDLSLDTSNGDILSTSTADQIGIHRNFQLKPNVKEKFISDDSGFIKAPVDMTIACTIFQQMPMSKLSHIVPLNDCLLISSWTGRTLIIRANEVLAKISKSKSSVMVSESSQGSFQGENDTKKDRRTCKVSSLAGYPSPAGQAELGHESDIKIRPGQRRRIKNFLEKSWCVIGYEDGSIAFHQIYLDQRVI